MNELEEFKLFCDKLNDKCIKLQDKEKEYISDEDAFSSYVYVKEMKLELEGDFLLFLACLNLLNTYVKQRDAKIGYYFKKEIDYFISICIRKNNKILKINEEKDGNKGNLIMVQINNIQFSFHSAEYQDKNIILDDTIKWDGIRKQKCALTIYNECKNNKLLRSNITYRGANLDMVVERYLNNYRKGHMDFNSKI